MKPVVTSMSTPDADAVMRGPPATLAARAGRVAPASNKAESPNIVPTKQLRRGLPDGGQTGAEGAVIPRSTAGGGGLISFDPLLPYGSHDRTQLCSRSVCSLPQLLGFLLKHLQHAFSLLMFVLGGGQSPPGLRQASGQFGRTKIEWHLARAPGRYLPDDVSMGADTGLHPGDLGPRTLSPLLGNQHGPSSNVESLLGCVQDIGELRRRHAGPGVSGARRSRSPNRPTGALRRSLVSGGVILLAPCEALAQPPVQDLQRQVAEANRRGCILDHLGHRRSDRLVAQTRLPRICVTDQPLLTRT
jgi:hypothetical protein